MTDLGQHRRDRKSLSRLLSAIEPHEGCHGYDDRAAFGHLAEARRYVPPQLGEHEIRAEPRQLSTAPNRPSRHACSRAEVRKGAPDKRVARIGPLGHGNAAGLPCGFPVPLGVFVHAGSRRREVLRRVNRYVGPTCSHGRVDFLHEDALATDRVDRYVLAPVPSRVDDDKLGGDLISPDCREELAHDPRLRERERRASSREPDHPRLTTHRTQRPTASALRGRTAYGAPPPSVRPEVTRRRPSPGRSVGGAASQRLGV